MSPIFGCSETKFNDPLFCGRMAQELPLRTPPISTKVEFNSFWMRVLCSQRFPPHFVTPSFGTSLLSGPCPNLERLGYPRTSLRDESRAILLDRGRSTLRRLTSKFSKSLALKLCKFDPVRYRPQIMRHNSALYGKFANDRQSSLVAEGADWPPA